MYGQFVLAIHYFKAETELPVITSTLSRNEHSMKNLRTVTEQKKQMKSVIT